MFSRFFITHPVFSGVVAVLTVLAGLVALPLLSIEQYPQITPPTVRVTTSCPGADARTLVDTVASPLEQAINGVEGMIYMRSTSSDEGTVNIDVTFELGTDPDLAAVRVQNRVSVAEARLPDSVRRQGVSTIKRSPSLLIVVSLISPDQRYDYSFLSNFTSVYVLDPLSRAQGVGDASIFGARDYAMRIWLDPEKLKSRNLSTAEVLAALRRQNVQIGAGQIGGEPAANDSGFTATVRVQGRLRTAEEFEEVVLKVGEDQRAVRVKDVARVELGSESYASYARRNGEPGAQIAVYQLPGSNAVDTVANVRAVMEDVAESFPEGLEYEVTFDFTKFVNAAIREVLITLGIAAALVILVVYVFLQSWRATLIPAITIPVSLVGTLAMLLVAGFSLNMLTLFGLVLAIGIVVDDAIVVVENCARKISETRCSATQAATEAMAEITGPVIATTLVVLAVFIPAALLPGLTGQLYRQFAITLSVATVLSSINALTLAPALCALLLKPGSHLGGVTDDNPERSGEQADPPGDAQREDEGFLSRAQRKVFRPFNAGFTRLTSGYTWAVRKLVALPVLVLAAYVLLLVATWLTLTGRPTGFLPEEDQGYFFVNVQLPDAAKLGRTDAVLREVEGILQNEPGVSDVIAVSGLSLLADVRASNYALAVAILDNWDDRPDLPAGDIIASINEKIDGIPDAIAFAFNPPAIRGLSQAGGFDYQLQDVENLGLPALQQAADDLIAAAGEHPRLGRVFTPFRAEVPQLFVEVDRTQVLKLGIELDDVFSTLQAALGSAYVNDFNRFGRTYRVYVQADAPFRQDIDDLRQLQVRNGQGSMTPLDAVVDIRDVVGPQAINRYNLQTAAFITGSGAPGVSSGDAIQIMRGLSDQVLPRGMDYAWSGATFQQIKAGNAAPLAFGLGLVVVYLVLAALYESWTIPVAILLSVPLAVLGAMVGLWTRGMANDIYAQIGLVLLIALVAKNAILIVEFAREQHAEGKPVKESAVEAAKLRFRPILMTALSFVLGMLPLLVSSGAGAGGRRVLGTAVLSGMALATVVGLLMTPAFYSVIQGTVERFFGATRDRTQEPDCPEDQPT